MDDNHSQDKAPIWINILIIVCMLPLLAFPTMLTMTLPDSPARTFAWFYPFYVIASGVCARICWPQRRDLTWILLVLMILSHAAMWMLILDN